MQSSTAPRPAIASPFLDWISCGGLSICLVVPLLLHRTLFGGEIDIGVSPSQYLVISALINWPHFGASYRLLYQSADNVRRFPFAAVYVPGALLVIGGLALVTDLALPLPGLGPVALNHWLVLVASLYLAWHYTGQAWGMVASYAFVEGLQIDARERGWIRLGCRVLLVWHFTFVGWQNMDRLVSDPAIREACLAIRALMDAAALVSLPLSALGFWRLRRRCGRLPLRVLTPWLALYLWYLLVALAPSPAAAFFWLQIFHALQYLAFPIRVEVNRAQLRQGRAVRSGLRVGLYYLVLVVLGLLIFQLPNMILQDPAQRVALVIANLVNIHHYFADGVIWKLRAPETRRDLFAHLRTGDA